MSQSLKQESQELLKRYLEEYAQEGYNSHTFIDFVLSATHPEVNELDDLIGFYVARANVLISYRRRR